MVCLCEAYVYIICIIYSIDARLPWIGNMNRNALYNLRDKTLIKLMHRADLIIRSRFNTGSSNFPNTVHNKLSDTSFAFPLSCPEPPVDDRITGIPGGIHSAERSSDRRAWIEYTSYAHKLQYSDLILSYDDTTTTTTTTTSKHTTTEVNQSVGTTSGISSQLLSYILRDYPNTYLVYGRRSG